MGWMCVQTPPLPAAGQPVGAKNAPVDGVNNEEGQKDGGESRLLLSEDDPKESGERGSVKVTDYGALIRLR